MLLLLLSEFQMNLLRNDYTIDVWNLRKIQPYSKNCVLEFFLNHYPVDLEISHSVGYWSRNFSFSGVLISKFRDQYPTELEISKSVPPKWEISRSVPYWLRNFEISTYWMRKFSRSVIFCGIMTPRAMTIRVKLWPTEPATISQKLPTFY